MSISKRLRRAAVGVAAVAVLGAIASTASAGGFVTGSANDPNTTNVPYLAWRGENLRMVKCFGVNDFEQAYEDTYKKPAGLTNDSLPALFDSIVQTNVQIEDWSGVDTGINTPKEVINGARTFLFYNLRTGDPVICFQDTWTSQKPGLGQFKLTVSLGLNNFLGTGVGIGAQVLVMQHQWLAGWMSLNAPSIDEVTSRDPATNPEGLGDPKGDGNFFAGDNWVQDKTGKWVYDGNAHPGEIRATVTGNLPLGQNFSELGLGASITLPNDWAALAGVLATDGNPINSNPAMRWDIHDEMVDETGTTTTVTGGRTHNATDAVANVPTVNPWWDGEGSFTRLETTTSQNPHPMPLVSSDFPTAGPFDPNFAEETLLPDGQLNAGDAPMPAARIDFAIAPNGTDKNTDGSYTDGVGSFISTTKAADYSIDNTGSNGPAKNLFAPFYGQWIPATARAPFGYASGVDGALITNNFPGFLTFGLIGNWEQFPLVTNYPTQTLCRRAGNEYRDTPGGPSWQPKELSVDTTGAVQTTAVYTDEHGEARIGYLPGGHSGSDFYFDALVPYGDTNNGCDLKGIKVLGTSKISAIARYPYQKVTDPDKPAKTTVTKTVLNLFDKHLSYYSKNYHDTSDNNFLIKVIVAHAQDINGQPFVGETVCFSGEDGLGGFSGFFPATGVVKVYRADGTFFTVTNVGETGGHPMGAGFKCTKTDENGNAVFEVQGSEKTGMDVVADFVDEGLARHIDLDMASPSTSLDIPALTPEAILNGSGHATTGAGSNGFDAPTPARIVEVAKAAVASGFGVIAAPAAAVTITPTQTITPTKTITVVKAAAKVRLLSMRLVRPAHAKAYIMVKVQSTHKTAKVTFALKGKNGKTISKITKTIATNKQVKIMSKSIKLSVKKISLILVK